MSQSIPPLEELVDFPAPFTFRILAANLPGLAKRCAMRVEEAIGREVEDLEEHPSSKGNWRSVRVKVTAESADEIRDAYQSLQNEPGVMMLL